MKSEPKSTTAALPETDKRSPLSRQVKKMKHRSVVAFILLAASLAAVPQAGQDLSELKSALGARVRSEIWSVFLSLNGHGGAVQTAPRSASHTLASCPNSPSNAGSKRSSAPSRAASSIFRGRAGVRRQPFESD